MGRNKCVKCIEQASLIFCVSNLEQKEMGFKRHVVQFWKKGYEFQIFKGEICVSKDLRFESGAKRDVFATRLCWKFGYGSWVFRRDLVDLIAFVEFLMFFHLTHRENWKREKFFLGLWTTKHKILQIFRAFFPLWNIYFMEMKTH